MPAQAADRAIPGGIKQSADELKQAEILGRM
jgi:hypothetical protein